MNKHDSERIAGLLDSYGADSVEEPEDSDIVVYMTCCVRESAESRLLGNVSKMKSLLTREGSPLAKRYVAIGGCIGQRDGESLSDRVPFVDVVFGTNNIDELPSLLLKSMDEHELKSSTYEQTNTFSTDLPTSRKEKFSAWLPITVGCDNFCTYCIVPYVRGREKSRSIEDIRTEAQRYVQEGVKEITLLGQNVNSYGTDKYGKPHFAEVLDEVDSTGIERLRFATSHPKDLTDEVIGRFSTLRSLMPALHLPVQSGSDKILERMNRRYTAEHYMGLIKKIREACPDIALSTDVIVGFPGETQEDFERTYALIDEVGYHQVFTFIYSPRTGTPAASYEERVPYDVAQKRLSALVDLVQRRAYELNQEDLGRTLEVLVEGTSKRDVSMLVGRSPKNQNVHAKIPSGMRIEDLEGKLVNIQIEDAKTWYLNGTLK